MTRDATSPAANYRATRLIHEGADVLILAPSRQDKAFVVAWVGGVATLGCVLLWVVAMVVAQAPGPTSVLAAAFLLAILGWFAKGAVRLVRDRRTVRLDRISRLICVAPQCRTGALEREPDGRSVTFDAILAIEAEELHLDEIGRTLQLTAALKDGRRLWLANHTAVEELEDDGRHVASFLGVPLERR